MEQFAVMSERETRAHVIEACRRGARDAFRQLFESHKDRVYSIALHYFSGDEATAGDITQQVFLKLFTRIGQFQGGSEFTTWLYRLTANACVDEQRKRRRWLQLDDGVSPTLPAGGKSQEHGAAHAQVAERVKEAVTQLKPKLRMAILLKYFEELSYEEIAAALGCSKGTVASRLNRGHKALAGKLGHLRGALIKGE